MTGTENDLALAHTLADTADALTLTRFRAHDLRVETKPDLTPVSDADRDVEHELRRILRSARPSDAVLGEEGGLAGDGPRRWVLDPIDGTKSFISGVPLFGTLIALTCRRRPVVGIIDQPISRERWVGVVGRPTTLNGAQIHCRACSALGAATLFATTPDMFKKADAAAFNRVSSAVKLTRFGADCYAYGLLAAGFIDLVLEASLKPYDFCAMVPIVEGAGGLATDWLGADLDLGSDGRILVAGDRRTHAAALALLGE